jgi:hypothetical protein
LFSVQFRHRRKERKGLDIPAKDHADRRYSCVARENGPTAYEQLCYQRGKGFPAPLGMDSKDAILNPQPGSEEEVSLLDILDHVLNAGVVLHGSVVISVAGVDLVYLGLNAILTSVETALKHVNQSTNREIG